MVKLGSDGFAFRNPPSFSVRNSLRDARDGNHDIDATLSMYFNHPTTPPFVAKTMIQRLVSSNPSPRYIAAVVEAFKTGEYAGFGNGKRGDMAATTAAIYLDREAMAHTLDQDPVHGGLKEPLLRVIHMMRALELELVPTVPMLNLRYDKTGGQFPFESPSVRVVKRGKIKIEGGGLPRFRWVRVGFTARTPHGRVHADNQTKSTWPALTYN